MLEERLPLLRGFAHNSAILNSRADHAL